VPPLHGPPTIAWEIQSIERLLERLENREMLKELVKQQRDIIYTNIATHASRWKCYQMYNKWGIRKLSTGRLRMVVYGMLWKDPKRCAFSPICFLTIVFHLSAAFLLCTESSAVEAYRSSFLSPPQLFCTQRSNPCS